MIGLLCFALAVLASPFKSTLRLEAENAVLRHQLIVLRRRLHGLVRFTNNDRWFFIQLYRWFPSILPERPRPERQRSHVRIVSGAPEKHVPTVPGLWRATSSNGGYWRVNGSH
jgi:hypothetical protein